MPRRHRLTITLREDLLHRVDQVIDSAEIRNRSHAIEVLLQRAMGHHVREAVILAAGAGVRLRPLTYELPKALLPVRGRPLLTYTFDLLRDHGIRDVVVVTGHLGERIERAFGTGDALGIRLRYVQQGRRGGTGGALLAARPLLRSSLFLCVYGDVLADLNLSDMIRSHESSQTEATIALTSVADPSAFGAVRLHGMRVAEFLEKPSKRSETSRLVFAGISVLSDTVFATFPSRATVSLERDIFPALLRRRALFGYPFEGSWFDISTAATYERAVKTWSGVAAARAARAGQ